MSRNREELSLGWTPESKERDKVTPRCVTHLGVVLHVSVLLQFLAVGQRLMDYSSEVLTDATDLVGFHTDKSKSDQ